MTAKTKFRLLVEGWRWIPHSYALVNVFQLLELNRRDGVKIYVRDVPYMSAKWQPTRGLLSEAQEAELDSLSVWNGETVDAVYRISGPFDLSPGPAPDVPVFVFLTSEFQHLLSDSFVNGSVDDIAKRNYLHFVTPSSWSHVAFSELNRPCHVVPHGVDQSQLYRLPDQERKEARESLKVSNRFVWLNISAMTGNKGIDILLQAFAQLCLEEDDSVLLLKGLGDIYNSELYLNQWLGMLSESDQEMVKSRIFFIQASLPFLELNRLFNVADCYVAPYRAEGFNMPVLEATSCGLPVLVSDGGSTDDFTNELTSRRIQTSVVKKPNKNFLAPDLNDLIMKMREIRADASFREQVRYDGPEHVRKNYGWAAVVDQLLDLLQRA